METAVLTNATTPAAEIGKNLLKELSVSTGLIVTEALRRNIVVEIIIASSDLFRLTFGKNSILCRGSITEKSNAVSSKICKNKDMTNLVLKQANINVPAQIIASDDATNELFMKQHKRIVVKPSNLSWGMGISMDVRSTKEMNNSILNLKKISDDNIILEELVYGHDIRVVVIDNKFVAAVHRAPPTITGDGVLKISELIATVNEEKKDHNQTPLDGETLRCVVMEGYTFNSVLPEGKTIRIRRNTNESTGGVPIDVTDRISPGLQKVAEEVARIIGLPVVGIDFLVPSLDGDEYSVIEVNANPELDGHEPQPIVEKLIDFLFPETIGYKSYFALSS